MIQDTYSLTTIKAWLDNYQALIAGDSSNDAGSNSGAKAYDGINTRMLIKIMLEDAISSLPAHLRVLVQHRWIMPKGRAKVLCLLGCSIAQYRSMSDKAIEHVYSSVNGTAKNYGQLRTKLTDDHTNPYN